MTAAEAGIISDASLRSTTAAYRWQKEPQLPQPRGPHYDPTTSAGIVSYLTTLIEPLFGGSASMTSYACRSTECDAARDKRKPGDHLILTANAVTCSLCPSTVTDTANMYWNQLYAEKGQRSGARAHMPLSEGEAVCIDGKLSCALSPGREAKNVLAFVESIPVNFHRRSTAHWLEPLVKSANNSIDDVYDRHRRNWKTWLIINTPVGDVANIYVSAII